MAGDSEKTMKNWSKIVESYGEIPDHFKGAFQALPVKSGRFPYTILTPSNLGFFHEEKPKLVCSFNHKLYIIEERKGNISTTCFLGKDINYIEVGEVLLRSWIKINGMTAKGEKSAILPINTVSLKYFKPIIAGLRTNSNDYENIDLETERKKFNYLSQGNFEFLNYARDSILPGEKVLYTVMQPEIRMKLKLFNIWKTPFLRTVSPAHFTILTDLALIIITSRRQRSDNTLFGMIWNFIPLEKIKSLAFAERTENIFSLTIGFPENNTMRSIFATANKLTVDTLVNQLSRVTNAPATSDTLQGRRITA